MKLILFDCDGTLVDSQNAIVMAMTHAFTSSGLTPPPRRAVLDIIGLSLPEAMAALAPVLSAASCAVLADNYRNAFTGTQQHPGQLDPLFPGAKAAIETLAARGDVVLGIATGKSMRGVNRLIAREGFEGHFATLQTADHHPSKPHPAMILAAMSEVGAAPSQTVMIGDTSFDIEMALNAGVSALGVSWGYHPVAKLEEAGAQCIADNFEDLARAIDEILGPQEPPS